MAFFGFVSVILEPNFDLSRGESNLQGELFPFRSTEISLGSEPSFQLVSLSFGEKYTTFPFLPFSSRVIDVIFTIFFHFVCTFILIVCFHSIFIMQIGLSIVLDAFSFASLERIG